MFRRFFAAVRDLIPACWRGAHVWHYEPLHYASTARTYSIDRECEKCGRREQRKCIKGRRSGDGCEIIEDPFSGWAKQRAK